MFTKDMKFTQDQFNQSVGKYGQTVRLDNVILDFTNLDPKNPQQGMYGAEWNTRITIQDPAQAKEAFEGMLLKVRDDNGKFLLNVNRKPSKKDGTPNMPVPVVSADNKQYKDDDPIFRQIGGGTIANVLIWRGWTGHPAGTGVTYILSGVQIVKLSDFSSKSGFDVLDTMSDAPAATATPSFGVVDASNSPF